MGRYGIFMMMIASVVALILGAWRLSVVVEARDSAASATPKPGSIVGSGGENGPIAQAEATALQARLAQAAQASSVFFSQTGSYAGLSTDALRQIDPALDPAIAVAWATDADYCVQTGEGSLSAHLQGSTNTPQAGPCP
jgi:hypothetical protein